jgi:16S rRNA (cytosine1402-N4)-methyltransferase
MPIEHVPVLATELLDVLDPHPGETAIDCTFGGGGHAQEIAERLGSGGTLIAIDRDPVAERRFAELEDELEPQTRFVRADFADALVALGEEGVRADVIYLDLGVSSLQLDAAERGFSYSYDAPLDMRMDPEDGLSAADLVNQWPEERIATVLREYGEERHARSIAREIVRRRPLHTTAELVEAIRASVPPAYRFGRGHPAKRSFQALRIAVNGELDSLDRVLPAAWDLLRDRGRLAVISFHSLEDRRVKRFLADRIRGCVCPPELPQGEPRSAVHHPREPRRRASGVHAPHVPTRGRRCRHGSSRSRSARRPAPSQGSPSRAWSTASRAAGCGSASSRPSWWASSPSTSSRSASTPPRAGRPAKRTSSSGRTPPFRGRSPRPEPRATACRPSLGSSA